MDLMALAADALKAQNPAEAYRYFTQVLETDPTNAEAWIGKALASGLQSDLNNIRLPEMLFATKRAIETAAPDQRRDVATRALLNVAKVVAAAWQLTSQYMNRFQSFPSYALYTQQKGDLTARALPLFAALDEGIALAEQVGLEDKGLQIIYVKLAKAFLSYHPDGESRAAVETKLEQYLPQVQGKM